MICLHYWLVVHDKSINVFWHFIDKSISWKCSCFHTFSSHCCSFRADEEGFYDPLCVFVCTKKAQLWKNLSVVTSSPFTMCDEVTGATLEASKHIRIFVSTFRCRILRNLMTYIRNRKQLSDWSSCEFRLCGGGCQVCSYLYLQHFLTLPPPGPGFNHPWRFSCFCTGVVWYKMCLLFNSFLSVSLHPSCITGREGTFWSMWCCCCH